MTETRRKSLKNCFNDEKNIFQTNFFCGRFSIAFSSESFQLNIKPYSDKPLYTKACWQNRGEGRFIFELSSLKSEETDFSKKSFFNKYNQYDLCTAALQYAPPPVMGEPMGKLWRAISHLFLHEF
jgi:hypothetical protein